METKTRVINKVFSRRWILTIICGSVFAYLSCTGMIEAKDALMLIGIVFTFYFTRKRPDEIIEDETPTTTTTTTTTT